MGDGREGRCDVLGALQVHGRGVVAPASVLHTEANIYKAKDWISKNVNYLLEG